MNEQWIALIEYSSYRSHFPESVPTKTGVEKLCQATDRQNGWIFFNDNREESLIVSFSNPVFINEICIYENLNPGSVIRLEMLESRRSRLERRMSKENFIVLFRSLVDNVATKISDRIKSTNFSTDFTTLSSSIENHSCYFRSKIC